MDFPLNRPGLHDSDLSRVFRYAPQETTVARFLAKDPVCVPFDLSNSSMQGAVGGIKQPCLLSTILGTATMAFKITGGFTGVA